MEKVLAGKITKKLQHLWGNGFLYLDFSIFLTCEKSFVYSPPPKPSSNPTNAIFLVLLLLLFPFSPFLEFLMSPKEEDEAERIFCPLSGSLSHRCQKRKVFLGGRVYFILLLLPFQRKGGGGSYIYCLPFLGGNLREIE